MPASRSDLAACLAICLTVLAVYGQTIGFDFIRLDDNINVTNNQLIQSAFSWESLGKILTTPVGSLWIPATMLSFFLDFQIFGLNPAGYHLTNVLFHLLNSIILFFLIKKMTGRFGPALVTALLLAVHPLHVESVAWITERKDVLSGLFFLATIWFYHRYTLRPGFRSYWPVPFFMILACLAKPMAVTLPFVLLLIDYWPLERLEAWAPGRSKAWAASLGSLAWEKAPLLLTSIFFAGLTVYVAGQGGAVESQAALPLPYRLTNAAVSYATYPLKVLWPASLAVLYPHPGASLPWGRAAASAALLLLVTVLFWKKARRHRFLLMGWLWYLGTLAPVIGLIQAGPQAMADRFIYLPSIGLYLALVWSLALVPARRPRASTLLKASAVLILAALALTAHRQAGYWRDSLTLFRRAVEVTENNYLMHNNYGHALTDQGRLEEALEQFALAWQINPDDAMTNYNLGTIYFRTGRLYQAVPHLRQAVKLNPDDPKAHLNLGGVLLGLGRLEPARRSFATALSLDPENPDIIFNLGVVLAELGQKEAAAAKFRQVLEIRPDYTRARRRLEALEQSGPDHPE